MGGNSGKEGGQQSTRSYCLETRSFADKRGNKLRLYLCTWNVGGRGPPKDLTELLDLKSKELPDIFGVGFQEMDADDTDMKTNMWTCKLTDVLGTLDYVRVKVVRMQAMSLQVFVKRPLILYVAGIESEYSKAGMGGWWGNKGGVSIRFNIGGVSLIIVNCHLAAYQDNVPDRIEDFNTILSTQKFRDPDVDNILDHDYVFWMGDLNFRLDNISRESALKLIKKKDLDPLLKLDQLRRAQEEGLIFVDFAEGPITFRPTYKFDIGTDTYDTSEKQRIPAWCDRILYRAQTDLEGLKAKQQKYASAEYTTADHKPVMSMFDINLLNYKPVPSYTDSDHKAMTGSYDVKLFNPETIPWVIFSPVPRCKRGKPLQFHYTIRRGINPDSSPWDWIGLYKANFRHFEENLTYVWGKNDAEDRGDKGVTLEFSGSNTAVPAGRYVLGYISKYKGWLRGLSNVFEIV